MTSEQIKALDHQSVMQTYGRFDVVIDHGEGATLYSSIVPTPLSDSSSMRMEWGTRPSRM